MFQKGLLPVAHIFILRQFFGPLNNLCRKKKKKNLFSHVFLEISQNNRHLQASYTKKHINFTIFSIK